MYQIVICDHHLHDRVVLRGVARRREGVTAAEAEAEAVEVQKGCGAQRRLGGGPLLSPPSR
jgi:hypothetical protein